jgi:hypothetical protein
MGCWLPGKTDWADLFRVATFFFVSWCDLAMDYSSVHGLTVAVGPGYLVQCLWALRQKRRGEAESHVRGLGWVQSSLFRYRRDYVYDFVCVLLLVVLAFGMTTRTKNTSTKISLLWRLPAAALAPFVILSADLLWSGWLYHGSGNHGMDPAIFIGIGVGSLFVLSLPVHWSIRILCLLFYVPLVFAALIPYSLWFIAVVFHGMVAVG